MVNSPTVTNGGKANDVLLNVRINTYHPRSSAFYTVDTLRFPSFLSYPAINGLSGDAQTVRQLFRGHFAA